MPSPRTVSRTLRRPLRFLRQLWKIARFTHGFTPVYSPRFPGMFMKGVRLWLRDGFLPEEAFHIGLFNPALPTREAAGFISKQKMMAFQKTVNPAGWIHLTEEKGLFYRYCEASGVPSPRLYAIYFRDTPGWSRVGTTLKTREDWEKFFINEAPDEFVVKPSRGVYGHGIHVYIRSGGNLQDHKGMPVQPSQIYDMMASDPKFSGFVVQERIQPHPDMEHLSGTKAIQTVRFLTFIGKSGKCRIFRTLIRVIGADSITDNYDSGLTGNLFAVVNTEDGRMRRAARFRIDGSGFEYILQHPRTGVTFDGYQIPLWEDACRMVEDASYRFLPIRAIGWDVTISDRGPVVIEANMFADPPTSPDVDLTEYFLLQ